MAKLMQKQTEKYSIKYADRNDAEEISDLAHNILFDFYVFVNQNGLEQFFKEQQTAEAIRKQIDDSYIYALIRENGMNAGYLSYRIESDSVFLSKLYLSKEFRGEGIGSNLIDMIDNIASNHNCKTVTLHANAKNTSAISFYQKHGFRIEKEIAGYSGSQYLMTKTIKN